MAIVKVEKNSYTVDTLYQWDLNQTLEIRGLSMPAVPEVHFTNDAMVRAVRRFAKMDATGVIRVEVPNGLLQQPYRIKALVCIREGGVFKTYREILIPVKARPQPADYTITDDDDIYSFQALEDLVYTSMAGVDQKSAAAAASAAEAVNAANAAIAKAEQAEQVANGIAGTAQNAQTVAQEAKEAAEAAKTAASAPAATRSTATLTVAGWTGSAAPYTQKLTVAGILATDTPHISPVYSDALATALAEKEAWAMVSKAVTAAGGITFTCFEDKPAVAIPIQIEVVR